MTIVVAPSALNEVICETPGICANCRSSGAATDVAMVSALAPCQVARDLNGRKIDLRQRRDRQEREGGDADERDRRHQQRGGDRPADERLGEVHEAPLFVRLAACASMLTGALVFNLYCPPVTTRSPSAMPEVTMVRSPTEGPTSIGSRDCGVFLGHDPGEEALAARAGWRHWEPPERCCGCRPAAVH